MTLEMHPPSLVYFNQQVHDFSHQVKERKRIESDLEGIGEEIKKIKLVKQQLNDKKKFEQWVLNQQFEGHIG